MAFQHFGEVGADMFEVAALLAGTVSAGYFGRLEEQQGLAFGQGIAGGGRQGADDTAALGAHLELHLHRFQHGDDLAGGHGVALGHRQGNQHAAARRVAGEGAGRRIDGLPRAVLPAGAGREIAVRVGFAVGTEQLGQVLLDKAGIDAVADDLFALQQVLQQVQVARHAFQAEFAEGAVGAAQGARVVGGAGDQLGQQRVIGRAHRAAGIAMAVHPQAGAGGRLVGAQHAGGRARATVRVQGFQVDPQLHGTALHGRRLAQAELLQAAAGGQAQLGVQ